MSLISSQEVLLMVSDWPAPPSAPCPSTRKRCSQKLFSPVWMPNTGKPHRNTLGLHFLGIAVLGGLFHRRLIFLHFQPPLKPILVHIAPAFLGGGLFRLCFGGEVQTEVMLRCRPRSPSRSSRSAPLRTFFGVVDSLCAVSWTAAETVCTSLMPSRMAIRCCSEEK